MGPLLATSLLVALPRLALAQDEAVPGAAPMPALESTEATAPATTATTTVPVEPGLTADRKTEDLKPDPKPQPPVLKIGVGLRSGLAMVVNGGESDNVELFLSDGLADQANIRPYMTAQMTEGLSFFTSFEIGTKNNLGFEILDAIVQIKILPEFQIWFGQHIGANDRNNMNGPFFANGWNFPIGVPGYPFDVGARDRGVTFWGLIAGGRLKYHASALDLQKRSLNPAMEGNRNQALKNARYAGRVTLHLLEPEDFYYNSGTYFGKKDVLALGAVINYQDGVDTMSGVENDFLGYSFDLLFEKNLGAPGTITIEGGYWDFSHVDAGYVVNQGTGDRGTGLASPPSLAKSFMASASWLAPNKTGIGQLQPNVRWQMADYEGMRTTEHTFDAGLGYIIDGFNNRWYLNYRHVKADANQDIVQVGAQFMM